MLKRFLGFLLAGALLIGFGYLFYLNPSSVEFRTSAARAVSLPLPLLLLLAFLAGAVLIFVLALLRETQWTLADWRRRREERRTERERSAIATGRALQWQGLSDQARRLLRRSRRTPETLEGALLLAEAALESGRFDEAEEALQLATARYPESPQPLALLAALHRRVGRPGLATGALEKAVAIEPRSPRLLSALRDSYAEEGRWVDAFRAEQSLLTTMRFPEQILDEQPRIRGLRYQAALSADGDATVAEELRVVLAQYPEFVPAAVSLGDALRRLGRPRDAARVWARAAAQRPLPVLLSRLESVFVELARPKRMMVLYRRLRRQADSPTLRLHHARFLLGQGDVEQAVRELESVPPLFEQLAGYHELWAEIHQSRGDVRLALDRLRRMLDFNPLPLYVCRRCERREPEWVSRCPGCRTWDSLDPVDTA